MKGKLFASVLMGLRVRPGLTGVAGAATSDTRSSLAVWYTHSYYVYESDCDHMGQALVNTGQILTWTCVPAQSSKPPWGRFAS